MFDIGPKTWQLVCIHTGAYIFHLTDNSKKNPGLPWHHFRQVTVDGWRDSIATSFRFLVATLTFNSYKYSVSFFPLIHLPSHTTMNFTSNNWESANQFVKAAYSLSNARRAVAIDSFGSDDRVDGVQSHDLEDFEEIFGDTMTTANHVSSLFWKTAEAHGFPKATTPFVHTPTLDEWEAITTQFVQPVHNLASPITIRTDIMFVPDFSFPFFSFLTLNFSGQLWDGTPVYAAMGPMLPDNIQSPDSGNGIQVNDQSLDQRSLQVSLFSF